MNPLLLYGVSRRYGLDRIRHCGTETLEMPEVASAVSNIASGNGPGDNPQAAELSRAGNDPQGSVDAEVRVSGSLRVRKQTHYWIESNAARSEARHLCRLAAGHDREDPRSDRVGSRTCDRQKRRWYHTVTPGCK